MCDIVEDVVGTLWHRTEAHLCDRFNSPLLKRDRRFDREQKLRPGPCVDAIVPVRQWDRKQRHLIHGPDEVDEASGLAGLLQEDAANCELCVGRELARSRCRQALFGVAGTACELAQFCQIAQMHRMRFGADEIKKL